MNSKGAAANPFVPAWFLPGPHLQSVWGPLVRPRRFGSLSRERLVLPDGDEVFLDHSHGPQGSPRVLLIHGLEGSSHSFYIQGLLRQVSRRGWRGVAMNLRSCARDPADPRKRLPNLRPRLYHSGETEDIGFVIRTLAARESDTLLFAVGVSLGGNMLLKWLGENPAQSLLAAAATISVPFDLAAGSRYMETAIGRLYVSGFLVSLRPKVLSIAERFPTVGDRLNLAAVLAARTFFEFDAAATAPLCGFSSADDYYRRSSSEPFLPRIAVPTLCLAAEDDPFLPPAILRRLQRTDLGKVTLLTTGSGGHAGFVAFGRAAALSYWAEEEVVRWLATNAQGLSSERARSTVDLHTRS